MMERLPLRLDARLARALGTSPADLELTPSADGLPALRGELPSAAVRDLSLMLRVHSSAGIPLAFASAAVRAGDRTFETGQVTLLAMEGYAHLAAAERQRVERRIWSRRAFAVASAA